MMYSWFTIIGLLLRDSDDQLTMTALRPAQSSILLRMFVHSAVDLTKKHGRYQQQLQHNKQLAVTLDNRLARDWESLNEHLQTYLSGLLTRFKDDETNLAVMVDLLQCCDYTSNEHALQATLKVVLRILESTRNTTILTKLVAALRGWIDMSGTISGTVDAAVRSLVNRCWNNVVSSKDALQKIADDQSTSNSSSSSVAVSANKRRYSSSSRLSKGVSTAAIIIIHLYIIYIWL